jgi:hypothetical protein
MSGGKKKEKRKEQKHVFGWIIKVALGLGDTGCELPVEKSECEHAIQQILGKIPRCRLRVEDFYRQADALRRITAAQIRKKGKLQLGRYCFYLSIDEGEGVVKLSLKGK